ncbi:MAG: DUF4168 domain-containing protein [Brevundimonas sp.]|uniref:DUF4168 domain-containing protein n=1 Tax=Brevundimonas sp. TaxID=1871086 RepID=UPI0011FB7E3D|nr:DUF4168 domain-containing protein [Brevundimonas sp.]RZJ18612.1 MAG: DUF4168 domain-containing protein [Brevundimonas sp.]
MRTLLMAAAASAFFGTPALAQDVAAPAAAEATATASAHTDAQLKQFADAMDKIRDVSAGVQNGQPTPEQQTAMAAAVEQSGLDVATYNAIATAVSQDRVLAARVAVVAADPSPAGTIGAEATEAELTSFAAAYDEVRTLSQQIQNGQPTPEQQAAMAGAVEKSGLAVDRFNAIAGALPNDASLRARVQLADAQRGA